MKTRLVLKPTTVFACTALFFGALFGACTPSMQVADEGAHFLRAYQLSTGTIIATRLPRGQGKFAWVSVTGGELPVAAIELADAYEPMIYEWFPKPLKVLEETSHLRISPGEAR